LIDQLRPISEAITSATPALKLIGEIALASPKALIRTVT
jgi:hypothetical protein